MWLEPLCTSQSYPVIGSPTGWWDDNGTLYEPDDFSVIGHSCDWQEDAEEGCGDGVCDESEGFDPTTCWEDCVESQWIDAEGQTQVLRDRVLFFGANTAEHWQRNDDGNDVFLITDIGFQGTTDDDPFYTGRNGCGSQILWVRRDDEFESGGCVERRFRGRTLSHGRLLSWTHSAERTHDGDILVTDTNASVILKLDAETGEEQWRLDGLRYSSESGVYCAAGGSDACCTADGCNEPFAPHVSDDLSGGISYQNMAREIHDEATAAVRYLLSNRSMETLGIIDAVSLADSAPRTVAVTENGGTKYYGQVAWAFGFENQKASHVGTAEDLCKLDWPHGVRYVSYGYGTAFLWSADLLGGRVVQIPYNHDCYASEPTNVATALVSGASQPRAVDPAAPFLYTQASATYPAEDTEEVDDLPTLYIGDPDATDAIGSGSFPFDLRRFTVEGDPVRYVLFTSPMCAQLAEGTERVMSRFLVVSLWTESEDESTLSLQWVYPGPATYPLDCTEN